MKESVMDIYCCDICGYVYDPEDGDPEHDIRPGTSFKQLANNWRCPECRSTKASFAPIEAYDPDEEDGDDDSYLDDDDDDM